MKVLLINPPYQTITSNVGVGHQVPLGLLMVGGPLIDAGHRVRLIDAECRRMSVTSIVREVERIRPDVVMTGHAGSTPAHPVCIEMLRAIKQQCPHLFTVYGGVYPTYHARQILDQEPAVDCIVRGEGEATTLELVETLSLHLCLHHVQGLTVRADGRTMEAPARPPIRNLDHFRIGWELVERWDDYRCFGLGRAAIIQFSRGCPHRCTYCGQHGFWVSWRHRDPVKLVDEIQWLHRTCHVQFITLADENPTTMRSQWQRFLEELVSRKLPVSFFATIRATDIVRDAALLPLYREAGILYVLMGIESTSDDVLRQIHKGSTTRHDLQACHLLRQHGIFSILGHIVGFEDETRQMFVRARRQLALYDGDYLNAMYVTPHDWTIFGKSLSSSRIIEPDQSRWDYRHQVLAQRHLRPWQLFMHVKWLELCFHLRPRRLWRMMRARDPFVGCQYRWCGVHTGMVWLAEVVDFLGKRHARVRDAPVEEKGEELREPLVPLRILSGQGRERERDIQRIADRR